MTGFEPRLTALHLLLFLGCVPANGRERDPADPAGVADTLVWTERAPLPEARTEVSVTADGSRIYLIGGFAPPREAGERTSAPRAMWAYDPAADRWSQLGEIPEGVNHAPFVHFAGRLYIVGGFRENTFEPMRALRIYDIAAGTWTEGAPMPTPRGAHAVVVLNGRIHAIGGTAPGPDAVHEHDRPEIARDNSVGTHEAYDPATDSWLRLAPMPTPRNHLGAAVLDGRIHAIVGRVDGNPELTTHEIYDPVSDAWITGPEVPTGRSGVAVVERAGSMYLFGGETFLQPPHTFDEAERYDPRTGTWEVLPPMPSPRHGLGAALLGDGIHVISGGPQPGFTYGTTHERLGPAGSD